MEVSKELSKKIEELRILEVNSNNFLMQRQSFQVELNEIINAIEEVKKSSGDVYKVSSNIMLKADKSLILNELQEKKKLLEIKVNSIEKQENILEEKAERLRKEVNTEITKK
ncbi:prefoldin subunit [Candidatus Pacearchaeota archaeon]|nr:hypothetical protein [uncultured archaeon]MBS3091489.1 prefoldin subunit [Candidatus Pacearchaeota archaeon]